MTSSTVGAELPEHPAVALARTGPESMPLCVRMRAVPHGLRSSALLLAVLLVIFVSFGTWVSVSAGGIAPLLSFTVAALVMAAGFAVFMVMRARGPALAADEHGVWLRPGLTWEMAAWQPWHGIAAVTVRSFAGTRYLCVKPHDPAYERMFAISPTGNSDTKHAMRIVKVWRERRLPTNLIVPVSHADLGEEQLLARLRELAGERCPIG